MPVMRECDDKALRRGRVFIDFDVPKEEVGDLVGALHPGTLQREAMAWTLGGEEGVIPADHLFATRIAKRPTTVKIPRRHGQDLATPSCLSTCCSRPFRDVLST